MPMACIKLSSEYHKHKPVLETVKDMT